MKEEITIVSALSGVTTTKRRAHERAKAIFAEEELKRINYLRNERHSIELKSLNTLESTVKEDLEGAPCFLGAWKTIALILEKLAKAGGKVSVVKRLSKRKELPLQDVLRKYR